MALKTAPTTKIDPYQPRAFVDHPLKMKSKHIVMVFSIDHHTSPAIMEIEHRTIRPAQLSVNSLTDNLHPLAATPQKTGGRIHSEPEHHLRSPLQRDRDRIIHCQAFRRLEYKTQVFVNHEGDHYRTRLTHTIEVAQIARTLARVLGLNEDLAECIGLGHDLGHPPFGHAGERQLNELLKENGGFEHNKQTVRIITFLEQRYPMFAGLNLNRITLRGFMKHNRLYANSGVDDLLAIYPLPPLESRVADLADSIAYNCHDLDDGLAGGYLTLDDAAELILWQKFYPQARANWSGARDDVIYRYTIRCILNYLVEDFATHSTNLLAEGASTYADFEQYANGGHRIEPGFSQTVREELAQLRRLLQERLYRHPRVQAMSEGGMKIVRNLYKRFSQEPQLLPDSFRDNSEPDARTICDYIAGMTDRYASEINDQLS